MLERGSTQPGSPSPTVMLPHTTGGEPATRRPSRQPWDPTVLFQVSVLAASPEHFAAPRHRRKGGFTGASQ